MDRVNFTILKLFPGTEFWINSSKYGIKVYNPPFESFYGQTDMKSFVSIKNGLSSKLISNLFYQEIRNFWKSFYNILPWEEIPSPKLENNEGKLI